ncbi:MAG: hypothetical protein ACODAB_01985 [Gemmatimonadota bacterium]
MEDIENKVNTDDANRPAVSRGSWGGVLRDLLLFQFKLVVDGLKDLCLAQLALGAAVIDLVRRDGSPGRRFYGVVQLSERFDGWLDLHEPLTRVPEDAPQYAPPAGRSVDDIVDRVETTAHTMVRLSNGAFGRA